MSRVWKVLLVFLACNLCTNANTASSIPPGDPYYQYVAYKNPKLRPREIAEIINANRKFSEKYHVSMFWHMCKSGYESGFKTGVGDSFYGDKLEPCYGIERLQVKTVVGMVPSSYTKDRIRTKLQHDNTFAIEQAYKLDAANRTSAYRMGYKTVYENEVVGLILYNAGLGNWKNYHYNLGRYLRHGNKLEDLSVKKWREYHFNFREIYSLNYYVNILTESDKLNQIIRDSATPTPVPVKLKSEVATLTTR